MKLKGKLWLIVKEVNASRTLLIFLWLTLSVIISAFTYAYMLKDSYIDSFYEDIDRKNQYKFSVDIMGTNYSHIDELNKLGFSKIDVVADNIINADFEINNTQNSYKISLLTDEKYFKNHDAIYVSSKLLEENQLNLGDSICLFINDSSAKNYVIDGYFDNENNPDVDIMLPFDTFYSVLRTFGMEVNHSLKGTLVDSSKYLEITKNAEDMNILLISEYDSGFKFIRIIESVFYVFLVLMTIFAFVSFYSIYRMLIKNRIEFINRLILLGAKHKDIDFIFCALSLMLILVSFLTSRISLIPVNKMIETLIKDNLGLYYVRNSTVWFNLILIMMLSAISLFSILLEGRKYRDVKIKQCE